MEAVTLGKMPAVRDADRAGWIDALSEELLDALPLQAWQQLFLGAGRDRIRLEETTATLLCCELPAPEWSEADVRTLAARFDGTFERGGPQLVLSFARPRAALELAILLQRTCMRRLRSALLTGPCTTAFYEVEGDSRRLTLGEPASAVRAMADGAPPGSIHLCAATWRALGPAALERHTQRALVTTEFQGEHLLSAFVTLAPPPRADLSTFAGLGLV